MGYFQEFKDTTWPETYHKHTHVMWQRPF